MTPCPLFKTKFIKNLTQLWILLHRNPKTLAKIAQNHPKWLIDSQKPYNDNIKFFKNFSFFKIQQNFKTAPKSQFSINQPANNPPKIPHKKDFLHKILITP